MSVLPGQVAGIAAFAIVAAIVAAFHLLLPLRFPVPWPDEVSFIAPAFEFSRHGTFFVAGLNPQRVVMWMPPAYTLFLALLFRVFGYGLELVRWSSAACMLATLCLIVRLIGRSVTGKAAIGLHLVAAVAFLSPYMLLSANIGRMDWLLAFVITSSLWTCIEGRPVIGAAMVVSAAAIHFNAVYFTPPSAIYLARWAIKDRRLHLRRGEIVALSAACLVLAAYAVLIVLNLHGFQEDMRFQFEVRRIAAGLDTEHTGRWALVGAILAAAVMVPSEGALRRSSDRPAITALYGVGFMMMASLGHEVWYDFAFPLGFVLLTISLTETCLQPMTRAPRLIYAACLPVALAATLATGFHVRSSAKVLLPSVAMLGRPLFAPASLAKIRKSLSALPPGTVIEFGWMGVEPLFFDTLDRAGLKWRLPIRSVTTPALDRPVTWMVLCQSADLPPNLPTYPRWAFAGTPDNGCSILALP